MSRFSFFLIEVECCTKILRKEAINFQDQFEKAKTQ